MIGTDTNALPWVALSDPEGREAGCAWDAVYNATGAAMVPTHGHRVAGMVATWLFRKVAGGVVDWVATVTIDRHGRLANFTWRAGA